MSFFADAGRLQATLGAPSLKRLREGLRRRLELGRELVGQLTLREATIEERRACDALFARKPTTGRSLTVDLDELAALFRDAGVASDLTSAVETLTGPVANRRALAAAVDASWNQVFGAAFEQWTNFSHPMVAWLEELAAQGALKRLTSGDPVLGSELLAQISLVIAKLPVQGEPIAGFAARLFGDAHALDVGSARATLAVRAAACFGGVPFEDDAEGRRTAWASVGIYLDELSTPALTFNLPATSDSALAQLLRTAAQASEPLHLSLRWLLRDPLDQEKAFIQRTVFVCENPTIVAMAARQLGCRSAPLVCVNGQPATPVRILLRQLANAGASLRYHGDMDRKGIEITSAILSSYQAQPWRMQIDDYLVAPKGKVLKEPVSATPWCPGLAEAMNRECRAVHEESVASSLLADLDTGTQ